MDLDEYCKSMDSDLFAARLYEPLKYIAAFLCKKYHYSNNIEENIQDVVSHCIMTLPEAIKRKQGTTKGLVYKIMGRYIFNKIRDETRECRTKKKLVYIEDMTRDECNFGTSVIYEFEFEDDDVDNMKRILINSRDSFQRLNSKLKRNIADEIIDMIIKSSDESDYIIKLSEKLHCSKKHIYSTIKEMREIIHTDE
jgi:hypothetical protein